MGRFMGRTGHQKCGSDSMLRLGRLYAPYGSTWTGTPDERGEFELTGLVPGQYRVLVMKRQGRVDLGAILRGSKSTENIVTVSSAAVVTLNNL